MTVTDADLDHLAQLARLDLAPAEREALVGDLRAILAYFEQLAEVDTEGVEELVRPVVPSRATRPDVPAASLPAARVARLAVEAQDGFVKVPRTVDEG